MVFLFVGPSGCSFKHGLNLISASCFLRGSLTATLPYLVPTKPNRTTNKKTSTQDIPLLVLFGGYLNISIIIKLQDFPHLFFEAVKVHRKNQKTQSRLTTVFLSAAEKPPTLQQAWLLCDELVCGRLKALRSYGFREAEAGKTGREDKPPMAIGWLFVSIIFI